MITQMALDPFRGKKEEGKLAQQIASIEFQKDPLVDAVLQEYAIYIEKCKNFPGSPRERHEAIRYHLETSNLTLLTPAQITNAAYLISQLEANLKHYAGFFISRTIQQSYKAGYNEFTLILNDEPIRFLTSYLQGQPEKKIAITIHGNVRDRVGHYSQYIDVTICGDAGHFLGDYSKDSLFHLHGSAPGFVGSDSQSSIFKVKGSSGDLIASGAKNSKFYLHGYVLSFDWQNPPTNCALFFENKEAYERTGMYLFEKQNNRERKMLEHIKVIFVDTGGRA